MAKGWQCRTYYNVNPVLGLSLHDTMLPPLNVPAKPVHVEFTVAQGLWLGSFVSVGRNKKVVSDHLLFLGRMSDAGLCVPHISVPIPSWWNALTTLFGMSNAVFGSSSTKVACKNLLWGNEDCDMAATPLGKAPISFNLGCFDPFCLPTDFVVLWGTVYVGMSWSDILAAAIDIAIYMATDIALKILGDLATPLLGKMKNGLSKLGQKLSGKVAREVAEEAAEDAAEAGLRKVVKKSALAEIDDAAVVYAKKAAKLKGMSEALGMTEKELAEAAEKAGYSKTVKEVLENLDDNMSEYLAAKKLGLEGLEDYVEWGGKEIARENEYFAKREAAEAMREAATSKLLKDTIDEFASALDSAVSDARLWGLLKGGFTMVVGKITWTNLICRGNLLGSGTSGGVFSFDGLGKTDFFLSTYTFDDRAYKWADTFRSVGNTIADTAEDYWYEATGTGSDTTDADDDYWYDESSSTA